MFNFLKNIFGNKEEKIELDPSALNDWFSQQLELSSQPMHQKYSAIKEKIAEAKNNLKEHMRSLETAELKNPNITTREIQFMQGNRDIYIKKISLLFCNLELPEKLTEVLVFQNQFCQNLADFSKSTERPYYILQEFFAHESKDLALTIKHIETLIMDAAILHQQFDKGSGGALARNIEDFNLAIQKGSSLTQEKQLLESQLEAEKKFLAGENAKKKKLLESSAYKIYQQNLQLLQDKKLLLKQKEAELGSEFSVLDHAMKKYAKMSFEHEALTNHYLDNPLQALMADHHRSILKILHNMRESVLRDEIELKDKKKDKTLQVINNLSDNYFLSFLMHYNTMLEELDKAQKIVDADPLSVQLQEIQRAIEASWDKEVKIQKALEANEKSLSQYDAGKLRKEVEEKLSAFVKKTVVIKA